MWSYFFKPIFDRVLALLLLVCMSGLMLLVCMLVKCFLGSPALFTQNRLGLNEKIFKVYKFRSMTDQLDQQGVLLPDSIRLNRFGRFLRASSLDELPQLWNILKGEMSFVGPRPLLVEYLLLYNDKQKVRHLVMPGITGWAQVNGRNAISWQEKFKLDCWYVEHQGFLLDMKIVMLTIKKVFRPQGVQQIGHATVEKFNGAN